MTAIHQKPTSSLPNAAYVIGLGTHYRHAIRHGIANTVLTTEARCAPTKCGSHAVLVTAWGAFDRDNPHLQVNVCPQCAWQVAIAGRNTDAELQAMTPDARTRHALARCGVDPLVVVQLCHAILADADSEYGIDHPRTIGLLAHVTAHAPVLLLPEDCVYGGCDHTEMGAPCSYLDAEVACGACSVRAGAWAGEWEGDIEFPAPAPCGALQALADAYLRAEARPEPRTSSSEDPSHPLYVRGDAPLRCYP